MSIKHARPRSLSDWILLAYVLWLGSYVYAYVFEISGLKPLYTYFLLLGFTVLYVLYRGASGRPIMGSPDSRLYGFFGWLALYVVYGLFEFLRSTQDPVAVQVLITLGEEVLLAGAFAMLMSEPRRLRIIVAALAFLAVLGTVMNIWDFFDPVFSNVPGRAAGLYVNSNIAGDFIAMSMVGGLTAVRRNLRLPYLLFCGVGVLVTFSRESWIIWGLAVAWLGWQGYFGNVRRRLLMSVLAVIIGAGFTALLFAGQIGSLVANTSLQPYLTSNTAARLGIGASVLSGRATEQRLDAISDSLHEAASAPFLGHGLGYTTEWRYSHGPHDMYLLFLVEGGIPGLMLYLALVFMLWRAGVGLGRVMALQIIVSSFFTHNHLDQPAILIIITFVFAHGAITRGEARQRVRDLKALCAGGQSLQ